MLFHIMKEVFIN